ncbi:MAG TPA: hypothetical protein VMH90_02370, partial [Thermoplasmata archaeon]|nr:hypothetical protein [Thermoplasmata archaeon]
MVNQSTSNASATLAQAGELDWATVLAERSTGPFGLTLEVQRGMWTQYQYRLCAPGCAAPSYSLQASILGYEWSVEFLNLSLQTPLAGGGTAIG